MRALWSLLALTVALLAAAACGGGPRGWLACEPVKTVDSEPGIYVLDAKTCQAEQLTTGQPSSDQAWSPDGRSIVYSKGPTYGPRNYDIFVVDLEGNVTQITSTPDEIEFGPAWSPAGNALAFTSGPSSPWGGDRDVFVVDLSGGKRTNLTNTPHRSERSPTWSQDGTRIAFAAEVGDGEFEVAIVGADGLSQPVTVAREVQRFHLSWSPTGPKLAIAARGRESLLLLSEGDGSAVVTLAEDAASLKPVWSPDGTWIAYACPSPQPPAPLGLCIVNADGGTTVNTQQPLTSGPVWSPDGKTVVFAAEREILEWDITGRSVKQVASIESATIVEAQALALLPEGQLAFYQRTGHCLFELRILNLQGGDEGLLLEVVYRTAVWSPDRSRMAYAVLDASSCF